MARRTLRHALGCLCVLLAASSAALAKVHEFTLDNGLKLLVKQDHRAPVVVSQVWYKVGSSYEHNGITGVSHVLEHMMFKGTQKHPPGEFSRIIASHGGRENAFTSRDYTAYFQQLEKSRLPISFELEADRMRGLLLPEEEFAKEIKVVMEERRLRTEDKPESLTYEQFNATAFMSNPYRLPVIGWMDDLQNMQVGDLRAWYEQFYAPNNATLVVVGDVDPQQVLALAKTHFGPLKNRPITAVKPQDEPQQRGVRRIRVAAPAQLPYLIMGYKVPVLRSLPAKEQWEAYALEVLAGILDGGDSARLSSRLVRGSQIAARSGAGYSLYGRMNGLFLLDGTPAQGKTIAQLEDALRAEIKRLRDEPVTAAELERVKAQVVAENVYQRDSVFYQAMQIGTLEAVGLGWPVMDEYVDRIRAVNAEQVQAVARKYLVEQGLTLGYLDPLPIDPNKPARPAPEGGHHGRH